MDCPYASIEHCSHTMVTSTAEGIEIGTGEIFLSGYATIDDRSRIVESLKKQLHRRLCSARNAKELQTFMNGYLRNFDRQSSAVTPSNKDTQKNVTIAEAVESKQIKTIQQAEFKFHFESYKFAILQEVNNTVATSTVSAGNVLRFELNSSCDGYDEPSPKVQVEPLSHQLLSEAKSDLCFFWDISSIRICNLLFDCENPSSTYFKPAMFD
ncbi:hypothetical protein EDC94DRAFT_663679 [Helicostylum pulchrum]|nr:hypothetical protein EDC94DRAFT_663679 [Helicostylum pulchrum]